MKNTKPALKPEYSELEYYWQTIKNNTEKVKKFKIIAPYFNKGTVASWNSDDNKLNQSIERLHVGEGVVRCYCESLICICGLRYYTEKQKQEYLEYNEIMSK